jgi:hypothetical protein
VDLPAAGARHSGDRLAVDAGLECVVPGGDGDDLAGMDHAGLDALRCHHYLAALGYSPPHCHRVETAGQLLVMSGDNRDRLRSEASFARLCGAAPIPVSSGRTDRHRLDRGGDRQANSAVWRIALVRMGCHQETKDYVARRTAEGKTKTKIMRCLKATSSGRCSLT